MKCILDENLSPHLARALNALCEPDGHSVVHITEKFGRGIKDIEWLEKLGNEGDWVLVTKDVRISIHAQEKELWKNAKITTFFLKKSWNNRSQMEMAWRLVRWLPKIIEQSEMVAQGASFEIPINYGSGKFKQFN